MRVGCLRIHKSFSRTPGLSLENREDIFRVITLLYLPKETQQSVPHLYEVNKYFHY